MKRSVSYIVVVAILLSMLPTIVFSADDIIVVGRDDLRLFELKTPEKWKEAVSVDGFTGKALYTNVEGEWAKFKADKVSGEKTVYYYKTFFGDNNNDKNAKVEVFAGGKTTAITVDHTVGPRGWVELGNFTFNGDGTEYVKLRRVAQTGRYNTRIDSVAFSPVGYSMKNVVGKVINGVVQIDTPPTESASSATTTQTSVVESENGLTIIGRDTNLFSVKTPGNWKESPSISGASGKVLFTSTQGEWAMWRTDGISGEKKVYYYKMYHTDDRNDSNAEIEVVAGGKKFIYRINHNTKPKGWVELGTFMFNNDGKEYVKHTRTARTGGFYNRVDSIAFADPSYDMNNVIEKATGQEVLGFVVDTIVMDSPTIQNEEEVASNIIYKDARTVIVEPVLGDGGNLIGSWGKSGALKDYDGVKTTYWTAMPGDKCEYRPNVKTVGKVRVLFYNLFFDRNDEVIKATVYTEDGKTVKEVVHNGLRLSGWHDLGEFDFKGNGKEYVVLEKSSENTVTNTRVGSVMFQLQPDVQALPRPLERDAEVAELPPDAPPVPEWAKKYAPYFNANAFADTAGHWAAQTIERLGSLGIVEGKTPTAFEPEASVTNAELATLFVNLLKLSTSTIEKEWYTPYIEAANSAGLLKNTNIAASPEKKADRLTLAKVLYNTINLQGKLPTQDSFNEFEEIFGLSGADKDAVAAVVSAKLMVGSDGKLGLTENLTRAEAATVMVRILDLKIRAKVENFTLSNKLYTIEAKQDGSILIKKDGKTYNFKAQGRVVYSEVNPSLRLLNVEEKGISYNVPSWNQFGKIGVDVGEAHEWLQSPSKVEGRTSSLFAAGNVKTYNDFELSATDTEIIYQGTKNEYGTPKFTFTLNKGTDIPEIKIEYEFAKDGYYTFGYTGLPSYDLKDVEELWQPMVWTERRMPLVSYFTPEFHLPALSTMVRVDGDTITYGVNSSDAPFEIPSYEKSRFGAVLRTIDDKVQPQIYLPFYGNPNSKVSAGEKVSLNTIVSINKGTIPKTLETVVKDYYGYYDFRTNANISLNEVIENMIEYGMDDYYSKYMSDYKGFSYENDAPGTTKNVSATHPASLSLIFDNSDLYYRRALPLSEYMLSRNDLTYKFVDSAKQGSDKLGNPNMRASEYSGLFQLSGKTVKPYLDLTKEKGAMLRDWKDLIAIYKGTGEKVYLDRAIASADRYLENRMTDLQTEISSNSGWWFQFTPDYTELFELYDITKDEKYLDAAYEGARRAAQFFWYVPQVPFGKITVNKGGVAPKYAYHRSIMPMPAPETDIDAWRVSEIGLSAEAAFTSHGHRAIFMAFHAPYFMKIGSLKSDDFLKSIGRHAIIGRYENFPGYVINNLGHSDVYMKKDFPFKPYEQLTYNSIHYNHIWPQISLLTDFLYSDIFDKSKGAIEMPSIFVNSYAYLKTRIYGHSPGIFYGISGAWPYMPKEILKLDNPQINYGTYRNDNKFQIALTNQSNIDVDVNVSINTDLIPINPSKEYVAQVWIDNKIVQSIVIKGARFKIRVNANSITALSIDGISIIPKFEPPNKADKAFGENSYVSIPTAVGNVYGMVLGFGEGTETFYIYTDAYKYDVEEMKIEYTVNGKTENMSDDKYPFEFTLPYSDNFEFKFILTKTDGSTIESNMQRISK